MNLSLLFRVKRSTVVAHSDYNLLALDDDSHVYEMILVVVEAVIDNVACHLLNTYTREHTAPLVNAACLTKTLRPFRKPYDFCLARYGYIKLLIVCYVEVFGQQQIIFKLESYPPAMSTRYDKYRKQERGIAQREGKPQSV